MLIEIDKIKVTDRIRKDFGNIQELADDIKENGLINPPVVTPENDGSFTLLAGERRLRAMRLLEYKQIEVRTWASLNEEQKLNLEISENEVRKDFSKAERIDYARRLEKIESLKAKERMLATQNNESAKENFPRQSYEGQVRDIVAEKLNIGSGKQYEKEKYIVDNKEHLSIEDFENWDVDKLSTNKAYNKIKEQLNQKNNEINNYKQQLNQLKNQPPRIVEKEKIIDKTDYTLSNKNKQLQENIDRITREKQQLEEINKGLNKSKQLADELNKKYEVQVNEYMKVKSKILDLNLDPNGEYNLYTVMSEVEKLTTDIEDLLVNKLAPARYKTTLQVVKNSDLKNNFANIISMVGEWCSDMANYIGIEIKNNEFDNFIEIESEDK